MALSMNTGTTGQPGMQVQIPHEMTKALLESYVQQPQGPKWAHNVGQIGGVLGQLGAALAPDPNGWQARLGSMVAQQAQTQAADKNLKDQIGKMLAIMTKSKEGLVGGQTEQPSAQAQQTQVPQATQMQMPTTAQPGSGYSPPASAADYSGLSQLESNMRNYSRF